MSNGIVIRRLKAEDKEKLEQLIHIVERNLDNKMFWLPINDISRKHYFDESWTCFWGAFDNSKLIAAIGLFFNENEFGESKKALHLGEGEVAELGRALVDPMYRKRGIMSALAQELMKYAKEVGVESIIATTHPKNVGSIALLKGLGFDNKKYVVKQEIYERYIFVKKI